MPASCEGNLIQTISTGLKDRILFGEAGVVSIAMKLSVFGSYGIFPTA